MICAICERSEYNVNAISQEQVKTETKDVTNWVFNGVTHGEAGRKNSRHQNSSRIVL